MTPRERQMFLALRGIAANATACGACRMCADIAQKTIDSIMGQLAREEAIEVGLDYEEPQ